MPAGAGEGDAGSSYHSSNPHAPDDEDMVGELEEGLRAPLLSGRERDEYEDAHGDKGLETEPCTFSDLFFLADKVRCA